MEMTFPLKEIARAGVSISTAAALAGNPIGGGVGLMASGGLLVVAGCLDKRSGNRDKDLLGNQK